MAAKKTKASKADALRRKLINNEMNPLVDIFLSLLIMLLSPVIALSAFMHDRLMYKFLDRTYIYNVSWEVSVARVCGCEQIRIQEEIPFYSEAVLVVVGHECLTFCFYYDCTCIFCID